MSITKNTINQNREAQKKAVASRNSAGRIEFTPEERKEFCDKLKHVFELKIINIKGLSELVRIDRATFKTRIEKGSLKDSEIKTIRNYLSF